MTKQIIIPNVDCLDKEDLEQLKKSLDDKNLEWEVWETEEN